jgi:hypothetical chaperone protein
MAQFATRSQLEFRSDGCVGLDFGTTNSAIAAIAGERVDLADFPTSHGPTHTFPSLLYFEKTREGVTTRLTSAAGPTAIERYLAAEEKGRLIQSLKAYLADRRFDGTAVFSQRYSLQDMIALIVQHLLVGASHRIGRVPARVVCGRPVHFSNAYEDADDEFALARLREAIQQCGFEEIVFEFEPVAAAYSYEQTLTKDELILIGDFGGGTSDFSILHVGPSVRKRGRTKRDIVGNDGVALAGDSFDKEIIRKLVAPRLGMGSEYFSPPSKFLPIPAWPYEHLERWHYLSFLNTAKNLDMLERLEKTALIPERVGAFIHLIKGELGYQLHEAVKKTKFDLSVSTETTFQFNCEPIAINRKVTRHEFEKWIQPELQLMAACVDRLMASTGVAAADIDHVFLTGGTAFVPAVRQLFIDRFGLPKITGGEELTSVATGLALRAREEWPTAAASR